MHSPGIIAIHATTATNALHYIYTASGDDTTRRLALLQAVGWQPMYRGRVKLTDATGIDSLKVTPDIQPSTGDEAVGEIFATSARIEKRPVQWPWPTWRMADPPTSSSTPPGG